MCASNSFCRIQKEGIDAGLLQIALAVEQLDETNELSAVKEKIALIEAQLKELKPNLDVIAEYTILIAMWVVEFQCKN